MKKVVSMIAAAILVLSLAACGNRDNKTGNDNGGSRTDTTANGGTNNSANANNGGNSGGPNMGTAGNNGAAGSGGVTNNDGLTGNNGGLTGNNSGLTGNNSTDGSLGNDVRRAVDDVGDAANDLLTGGENATANRTSFQRMLDNARVHDVDGVLTDGENSQW